ncbi:MAG: DUF3892 domain-containing protein [Solirubrobacteraceae bacterium]
MIEITAIRFSRGSGHEHIAEVLWRSKATHMGRASVPALVEWLDLCPDNEARLADRPAELRVAVVTDPAGRPHIRARLDGSWTDDLLTLPRFSRI